MSKNNVKKIMIGFVGILIIAYSVVMQIKAGFGLDSLNALYGNLSIVTGRTFGFFSICLGFIFILINHFTSKKRFNWTALLVAFFIGTGVDQFNQIFAHSMNFESWSARISLFLYALILYGIGIALLIYSGMPSPLEELQFAMQKLTNQSVARAKFYTDLALFSGALLTSVLTGLGLGQINVGTIIITIFIGKIIEVSLQLISKIEKKNTRVQPQS
ncbi:hypothetical protein SANA_19860 [Gottschalkiaceae bacterium SANA]|nr:hypothetical protein SANA_19860 [Gottschalkiaceae bacterium SANA]